MNFNQITIHEETRGTSIITPENFYTISDDSVKYVVMYSLKFIDINPDISIIETKIPYYISDGATNKLRANMLYPFMCYSNLGEVENCPYDTSRYNSLIPSPNLFTSVLLKYKIDTTINIDKLEEDLLNTFLGIYPDLHNEGNTLRTMLIDYSRKSTNLISVLPRITNLVDFIICITNDVIQDFDYTSHQTKTDIDNGKYSPLNAELKLEHNYTDLSIFHHEIIHDLDRHLGITNIFNNHFRLVILTILNKYYNLFVNYDLFTIQKIHLETEIITTHMFNTIANICQKEIAKKNMQNYKLISNEIIDTINGKIDLSLTISEKDRAILKSIIILSVKTQETDDEIYSKSLKRWKSQCLSKAVNINTKNVFTMTVDEICVELSTYSDFLKQYPPNFTQDIYNLCNEKTCVLKPETRLRNLMNILAKVRSSLIILNYIGQLYITYTTSDNTEKTIVIYVDSSETIGTLKSKIFNKEGIVASHQELLLNQDFLEKDSYVYFQNDKTIASYKIKNNTELRLLIE